jgi:hypothetical protein
MTKPRYNPLGEFYEVKVLSLKYVKTQLLDETKIQYPWGIL